MTDSEIINGLECLTGEPKLCKDCSYSIERFPLCRKICANNAIDLIKRQQAEIEELNTEIDKQYEQAVADIKGNLANGGVSCHWCIEQNKAEAIKEFAERLGEYIEYRYNENFDFVPYVKLSDIEKVVYEMVGAEE